MIQSRTDLASALDPNSSFIDEQIAKPNRGYAVSSGWFNAFFVAVSSRQDSLAHKIIAARGATKRRPTTFMPILNKTEPLNERLEPFELSHGRIGRMPEHGHLREPPASHVCRVFEEVECPFGGPDMKIDEAEAAQGRKRLGRTRSRGCRAQEARCGVYRLGTDVG